MSEPHRMRLRNGIRTANGITGETEPTYGEYVLASDYDALAAACEVHKHDAMREIAEANELAAKCDALAADLTSMQMAYEAAHEQSHKMRERAIAAEARLAEAERDAALGRIAMRFVDRAGDYCAVDPPELICTEFYNAMAAEVERQLSELGLHTVTVSEGVKP